MKPYPLVALNHFTVPVATTLSTVHTTAQTSYGRALPPDTAQNTKTRDPKVIAATTETPRGKRSHAVRAHVAEGHGGGRSRSDVRYGSNSDRILRRSETTRCAQRTKPLAR